MNRQNGKQSLFDRLPRAQILDVYCTMWGRSRGGHIPPCKDPVLVVGFNHSGKSLLSSHLASHDEVCVYPTEGNRTLWFKGLYPWHESQGRVPPPWYDPHAFQQAAVRRLLRMDLKKARTAFATYKALRKKPVLLNDSGMAGLLGPALTLAFPQAKIIHVVRDPRAACHLSARKHLKKLNDHPIYAKRGIQPGPNRMLEHQARYWGFMTDQIRHLRETLGADACDQVLEVRYEDYCRQPTKTMGQVARFLGLRGPPPASRSPLRDQNGPDTADQSPDERTLIEKILEAPMQHHGYNTRPGRSSVSTIPASI
jgi:hypothetical protein